MNVKLVVEHGARRRAFSVQPPEAILGRARGTTVRIPSAEVSRQHCKLTLEKGLVQVEDLGSVNGTLLNGRRIRGTEYVRPGDNLTVGPVTFVVEYELTPSALERLRGGGGGDEDPAALLAGLADGDVVLEMDVPDLDLELLNDGAEFVPTLDDVDEMEEVAAVVEEDEEEAVAVEAEDVPPWQMPDGDAFRDMLSGLEDDGDPPPTRRNR